MEVDIRRQHDLRTSLLCHELDCFCKGLCVADGIDRYFVNGIRFAEIDILHRSVDFHISFIYVQCFHRDAFGNDQRFAGRRGVYFPEGALKGNRRFRGIDGQFPGGIGRDGNICGSFRVTRSTGPIVVFYSNGVARFGECERDFHVIVRGIYLRYHDLVARGIRQILDDDIGRAAFEGRLDICRAFDFGNHFLDGAVFIEFRVDRYADRALPGQQVARHVGAIVAADRNVGEGVVGADLRTAVVECHREIGERGPGFRGPEEIHRDRTVGLGEFCRLIADVGRSAHFARQGVERRGKTLESDLVSRGFQRLVSDFVQVVGLYHQQTERTFQGYGPGERARHFERLVGEERIPLVAVADERPDFRDRLQIRRIVGLVREAAFAAFGAVGPEYEVVGLLGDQPQVVEGNRLAGDALLDTVVEFVVAVDLQNTAVGRGAGAEIVGNRTGSVLRNGDRKRGGRCRVRNDTFVLLTCGEGQCKARRQQEEFFHGLLSFCELPPPSDFSEGEDVTQRFVIYFEELRFGI